MRLPNWNEVALKSNWLVDEDRPGSRTVPEHNAFYSAHNFGEAELPSWTASSICLRLNRWKSSIFCFHSQDSLRKTSSIDRENDNVLWHINDAVTTDNEDDDDDDDNDRFELIVETTPFFRISNERISQLNLSKSAIESLRNMNEVVWDTSSSSSFEFKGLIWIALTLQAKALVWEFCTIWWINGF